MINYTKNLSFIQNEFELGAFDRHFHEEYSIGLICNGYHEFSNNEGKYIIPKNIIRVINPFEYHTTYQSTWSYINIMPTIELVNTIAQELSEEISIKEFLLFRPIINDSIALSLFLRFYYAMEENSDQLLTESSSIEFLSYLITRHSIKSIKVDNYNKISNKKIQAAIDYIEEYYTDPDISLTELSNVADLNKFHFIRQFKKYCGITPAQYIKLKKINKAKKLLLENTPLSYIALECGFNDQSYLTKVFKQFFGYTPSQLKKRKVVL